MDIYFIIYYYFIMTSRQQQQHYDVLRQLCKKITALDS